MDPADTVAAELHRGGLVALRQMIEAKTIEQSFIDYKQTESKDYSQRASLGDSDKRNLREAISGFGNSEGGLIVWGVETRTNSGIPESLKPFKDPGRFHNRARKPRALARG